MKTEDDIGSLVNFDFRITNFGRPLKALGAAFLDIYWPKEIMNGKWLLYIVKIDSQGLEPMSCQPKGEINKLNLLESGKGRKRREIGERQPKEDKKSFSLFSDRKYMTLDCKNHAKCVTIRCPLAGLDINAFIKVRSRLWNGTFIEEYSKMNYLDILVKAAISIDTQAENIKLSNEGHQCGFFKRSRYDDSVPRYHAVRIPKEERQFKDGKLKQDSEKKQWVTSWNENESYS
ncbi:hypothetical protein AB205_0082940 [Aquarana catesbeiana]|uniref:Integrin alpha third immunoglobulin-like domain-containing protein n=2 Tax=Aquarana catesbeiana TaxID=8400 RepID=A0A2G9RXN8_AQUCT|nr:hypothetical protein AB205_0082940 [Aquarana catesbeiana]